MRRPNLSSTAQLEPTFSTAQVCEHLGIHKTKLHELLYWGRRMKGCHPLLGGLWPVYRVSHKNVRITQTAINRHLEHMNRIQEDAVFAAAMKAQAQPLSGIRYGRAA